MTIYLEVPLTEEIYQQVKALADAEQKEIEQRLSVEPISERVLHV